MIDEKIQTVKEVALSELTTHIRWACFEFFLKFLSLEF